jgi:hypothetical protein
MMEDQNRGVTRKWLGQLHLDLHADVLSLDVSKSDSYRRMQTTRPRLYSHETGLESTRRNWPAADSDELSADIRVRFFPDTTPIGKERWPPRRHTHPAAITTPTDNDSRSPSGTCSPRCIPGLRCG